MRYVICQKSKIEKNAWLVMASSDIWELAQKIADAMNHTYSGEYTVFESKNREELQPYIYYEEGQTNYKGDRHEVDF